MDRIGRTYWPGLFLLVLLHGGAWFLLEAPLVAVLAAVDEGAPDGHSAFDYMFVHALIACLISLLILLMALLAAARAVSPTAPWAVLAAKAPVRPDPETAWILAAAMAGTTPLAALSMGISWAIGVHVDMGFLVSALVAPGPPIAWAAYRLAFRARKAVVPSPQRPPLRGDLQVVGMTMLAFLAAAVVAPLLVGATLVLLGWLAVSTAVVVVGGAYLGLAAWMGYARGEREAMASNP